MIPRYILIWIVGVLIFQGILLTFSCNAEETTDLWFLVSSYEDTLVEDDKTTNTWQAVDSYYGIMDISDYYWAPYSFPKYDDIKLIPPQWQVSTEWAAALNL